MHAHRARAKVSMACKSTIFHLRLHSRQVKFKTTSITRFASSSCVCDSTTDGLTSMVKYSRTEEKSRNPQNFHPSKYTCCTVVLKVNMYSTSILEVLYFSFTCYVYITVISSVCTSYLNSAWLLRQLFL